VVKAFVQKKTAADKRGFMQARQEYPVWDMLERFAAMLKDVDINLAFGKAYLVPLPHLCW
jgi:hypothetical protein